MRPDRGGPRWCMEYAPRRRLLAACAGTSLRSFLPWRFWSQLRMEHRPRWRRTVVYFLWLLAPLALLYVIAQTSIAVIARYLVQQDVNAMPTPSSMIGPLQARIASWQQSPPTEVTEEQFRDLMARFQAELVRLQSLTAQIPAVHMSYVVAILEAVFLPVASSSFGTIDDGFQSYSYPPPDELWTSILRWWRPSTPLGWIEDAVSMGSFSAGYSAVVLFLVAGSFILVPVSRHRARVKWSHLWRIAAYGLIIPIVSAIVIAATLLHGVFVAGGSRGSLRVLGATTFLPLGLIAGWWWAAIRCYLRMPHGFLMALLLTVVAILVPPAVMTLVLSILGGF